VPARPATIGNDACVRSRAWIWDFSSMHSTIAYSGFNYRPNTSMRLSSNLGSVEILNVSTRCRLTKIGPNALHRRELTPTFFPIVRRQGVAPAGCS
jgi:hypothetical protein